MGRKEVRLSRAGVGEACLKYESSLPRPSVLNHVESVTKSEFLLRLDEMLELEPGTLKGTELLTELPRWDSLAIIGYIALLDEHFGVSVPASKINGCRSLEELLALVGPGLN